MTEREIFIAALQESSEADRAAFLRVACGDDAALKQRIEELLAQQQQLGSFLEGPAVPASVDVDENAQTQKQQRDERLGERIGPYKLLQVIGEGGMGIVYLSEQTQPVVRRVALKIIKPGMDTRQVIARFEAERQALAMMDHPSIAKVLDAGATASGRPYFVMELVKGVPITRYCDQQHLTPAQRLELFIPVCQAVQHAHQKGIIHRDLKPSNVLIALYDGRPVPKVIDFGVAKATNQRLTEKTMFTEVGAIIGTLEYMAPEQAELNNLDIDTRADIYSLGVILYELLTGSPPFSGQQLRSAAFNEMLRIIREDEPPRPSTKISSSNELASISANRQLEPQRLTRLVQGDLDWIVMKCLEKQRERRYETANGLASDIQRFLQHDTVLASPPSARYRLQKFLVRHHRSLTVATAIALTVLLGAVGTTAGLMRAAWERSAKEEARKSATISDSLAQAANSAAALARIAEQQANTQMARAQTAEREVQVLARLSEARAARLSHAPGQSWLCLEKVKAAMARQPDSPAQLELRNEAITALLLLDARPAARFDAGDNAANPTLDAEFKRFMRREPDGSIAICRVTDGTQIARIPPISGLEIGEFTADGDHILCHQASPRESLVWNIAQNREVWRVPGGLNATRCGRYWSWNIDSGEIRVFDRLGGPEIKQFKIDPGWHGFAASPDGKRLAVTRVGPLQVWDLDRGVVEYEVPELTEAGFVDWEPKNRFLVCFRKASGTPNHVLTIWDLTTRRVQAVSRPMVSYATNVAFHPSGEYVLTDGWDYTLRIWNTWNAEQELSIPGSGGIRIGFSDNGRYFGTTRQGRAAQIWELLPSECRRTLALPVNLEQPFESLQLSPDGSFLVAGNQFFDVHQGRNWGSFPRCNGLSFNPRGNALLAGTELGLMRWPIERIVHQSGSSAQQSGWRIGPPERIGIPLPIQTLQIDASSGLVLANDRSQGTVCVANLADGRVRRIMPHRPYGNWTIDSQGRWAASAPFWTPNAPETIEVWDLATGRIAAELPALANKGAIFPLFSPRGDRLVTSSQGGYQFWKTADWRLDKEISRQLGGIVPGSMCFAAENDLMALSKTMHSIQVLTAQSQEELFTLAVGDPENFGRREAFAFSRDGSELVIAAKSHDLHILHLRNIRDALAGLALDWESPQYADKSDSVISAPLTIDWGDWITLPDAEWRAAYGPTASEQSNFLIEGFKASPPRNLDEHYQRIKQLLGDRRDAASLAEIESRLSLAADDLTALCRQAFTRARLGLTAETIATIDRILAHQHAASSNEGYGLACNDLCYYLAAPRVEPAESELAKLLGQRLAALGERAVKIPPQSWAFRNTYGIALYRAERWDDAARELERALKQSTAAGYPWYDIFFLAATEQRRGNNEKARQYLDQGLKWCADNDAGLSSDARKECHAFRTEAEAVVGKTENGD